MKKNIFIILLIIISIFSCSKKGEVDSNKNTKKKVEIILSDDNEDNNKENIEIRDYNEDELKENALNSLKEFLSLTYTPENVYKAYDDFYSSDYKKILKTTRGISDAESYVNSNPFLDFEFETTINKVHSITIDGKKAYIDVDTTVYDRDTANTTKYKQTFIMEYENNKWVISY